MNPADDETPQPVPPSDQAPALSLESLREPVAVPGASPGDKPRVQARRIGPIVWVPELTSTGEDDPWKHRKGEPRIFTLFWTGFLMLAAFVTLLSVQTVGMPRAGQFDWGARSMLVLIAIGVGVLWPITRLSQRSAPHPRRAIIADLFVVMLPIAAILLPLPLMTGWSFAVVSGLAFMFLSWSTVSASLIWLGWRGGTNWSRGMATLSCIALATLGPGVQLFLVWLGYSVSPWWVGMASPTSSVFVLTSAPSGLAVRMDAGEWIACGLPMLLALVLIGTGLLTERDEDAAATEAR